MEQNYYELLGLARSATTSEIKARYKQLAKRYHPDLSGDNAKMAELNQAYDTLSDPLARYDYNRQLETASRPVVDEAPAYQPNQQADYRPKADREFSIPKPPLKRRGSFGMFASPIVALVIFMGIALLIADYSQIHQTSNLTTLQTTTLSGSATAAGSQTASNTQAPTPTVTAPKNETQDISLAVPPADSQTSSGSATCQPGNNPTSSQITQAYLSLEQTERQIRQLKFTQQNSDSSTYQTQLNTLKAQLKSEQQSLKSDEQTAVSGC